MKKNIKNLLLNAQIANGETARREQGLLILGFLLVLVILLVSHIAKAGS
jgi:hypothetical protein